ncbi:MAG: FIST C-terminal domain-containing protein [Candidatus Wildermuthbacteria bacterium]|nr:FIST C-terminal domain-containing protein [Candidatus Wildermuthbacteria bacterium]
MAICAGVGQSREKDAAQAGYAACKIALENCGKKPDLTIVFSSVSFDQQEMLKGVREASNGAPLVGCTDAGEVTNEGPSQHSVAVMAISSDQITFHTGLGENVKEGAREAGRAVAEEVKKKAGVEPLKAFIMFPDVLTGNGADIVRGVLDIMGEHFPVVGGAAGDDFLFEKTYEYLNDEAVSGAVGGVGLTGRFSMGSGVRHGWMPIGVPMKVTKSEGSVLHELDGKPAIAIYENYFGEKTEELRKEPLARMAITYPLGIKLPGMDEYLIRDPITVDEKGAITCAAEVPEGSEVRLMIGSTEKAVEAAQDAARKLMKDFEKAGTKPKFALMFNCIAREKLFGARAKEEIDAVLKIIGEDVPLLGFYTYGEQAPIGGELHDTEKISSRFYNETVVMFAVGE